MQIASGGLPSSIQWPEGYISSYLFDSNYRQIQELVPSGTRSSAVYDSLSNCWSAPRK